MTHDTVSETGGRDTGTRVHLRVPVASDPFGTAAETPVTPPPSAFGAALSVALETLFYPLRWLVRAPRLARAADPVAAAGRWARHERRLRSGSHASQMARIDFHVFALARRAEPRRIRRSFFTLPIRAPIAAARLTRAFGRAARAETGIRRVVQLFELWSLQLRFPLSFGGDPRLYYTNRMYAAERRADAPYLFSAAHNNLLSRAVNGAEAGVMDKGAFADRCQRAGIPAIPTLAIVGRNGVIRWSRGVTPWPPIDLFTKPVGEANGSGAARWRAGTSGRYRDEAGGELDPDVLESRLSESAQRGEVAIQPCLRNHHELEALVGDTLATVRVAALIDRSGRWRPVMAIHRSARRGGPVDNTAQGGCASRVDLPTGELGPVMVSERGRVRFAAEHPRTGATTKGRRLPCWPELLALVERAHRLFAEHPVIGWDLAITPDGPVLVEANVIWNARSLQAANATALGRTAYAADLLDLLETRMAGDRIDSPAGPTGDPH
jgi:hypothetical protein